MKTAYHGGFLINDSAMRYPYRKQRTDYFCGPTTVQMILGAYGIKATQKQLAGLMETSPTSGTRRRALAKPLRAHGLRVHTKIHSSIDEMKRLLRDGWSVIVNYIEKEEDISHFAVVTAITPSHIVMQDPWHGPDYHLPRHEFISRWRGSHPRAFARWYLAAK